MRSLITIALLGMFSAALAGCEASAKVDTNDPDHGATYKKTTTVQQPDGDRTTKTEVRTETTR